MTFYRYILIFLLGFWLGSKSVHAAKTRLHSFYLGQAKVSSKLTHGKQDSTVFLSFDFLEKVLEQELQKAGVLPVEGEKFVEFKGTHLLIRGTTGVLPFEIDINGEFYQEAGKRPSNVIKMDFTITFTKRNENFLSSLLDLVTLPVGMVFESVLNVIFATTDMKANVKDYFSIDVDGKFKPLAFLSRLGASVVNVFKAPGEKIRQKHEGVIDIEFTEKALKVLFKANDVAVGANGEGILVYFY